MSPVPSVYDAFLPQYAQLFATPCIEDPRRSLEMTHLCSLKVTHIENTFADTALNLFLRCERKLICPRHLLDDRVDSRQPIAYE